MSTLLVIDSSEGKVLYDKIESLLPGYPICQDSHFENPQAWDGIKDSLAAFVNVSNTRNFEENIRGIKNELNWLVVIAVSDSPNHEQSVACMRAGANDYIGINQIDQTRTKGWIELAEKSKNQNHLRTIFEYQTTHGASHGFSASMLKDFEEKIKSVGGSVPEEKPGVVLIVDDESANLEMTGEYLDLIGFNVLTALSGQAALDLAQQTPNLDVILLDMRMPGMKGDEVLRRLKAQQCQAEVIVLTAFSDTEVPVNSFKEGAIEYLNKSTDQAVLVEKIKQAVIARRMRLDSNLRLPISMRLDYFNHFQSACTQKNRPVTNADALYFFDELLDQIPADQTPFDQNTLSKLEQSGVFN